MGKKTEGFVVGFSYAEHFPCGDDDIFDTIEDAAARCEPGQQVFPARKVTPDDWWRCFPGLDDLMERWEEELSEESLAPCDDIPWEYAEIVDYESLVRDMEAAAKRVFIDRVKDIRWWRIDLPVTKKAHEAEK